MSETNGAAQVKARMMLITPKIAEGLLSKNTHNRGVTLARVDQYAADMRRGDWQVNGEAIKIAEDGQVLDARPIACTAASTCRSALTASSCGSTDRRSAPDEPATRRLRQRADKGA